MLQLYPLKFKTIFKDKIWGGNKINSILGKDFYPLPNCGETWEISGVTGNVSEVATGALKSEKLDSLVNMYKGHLVGNKVYERFGNEFPLLVKFLDAAEDLSIQVHPDDTLAKARHNSFGKTEMWYVVQADEDATLISGFNREIDEQTYLEKFNSGNLTDVLNKEEVEAGDVFFLPAGRVHTIGKGLLIAEIQQTSDITYRIYDFDRVDDKGNKRELHTEEALGAIDYHYYGEYKTGYNRELNAAVNVVTCPYFTTNVLDCDKTAYIEYDDLDSFVIHVCVGGSYILKYPGGEVDVNTGDCILIPATIKTVELTTISGYKILESYIK